MVFPVFFPVFNDKIVMRIWDSVIFFREITNILLIECLNYLCKIESAQSGYIHSLCAREAKRK